MVVRAKISGKLVAQHNSLRIISFQFKFVITLQSLHFKAILYQLEVRSRPRFQKTDRPVSPNEKKKIRT